MPLFPASFIDDLKSHVDIVQVVQERVQLRKMGATWKGLCPFHGERTPSFHVNGEKGFFHCFGCSVGGDVIKFVELHDKVGFQDAVRQLAARAGIPVPEASDANEDRESTQEREGLLKAHEIAGSWFTEQLALPIGAPARRLLADRGISTETAAAIGMGFAPASGGLRARLLKEGLPEPLLLKSGLIVQRDAGPARDRFRNRLIFPIYRENGAVVAFNGRAMTADQQPKYYNSPETPIYVKGRTLYGLNFSKSSISRVKHAVLVEGQFDWAQAFQGGITNVVASSGTALTPVQARLLRRFCGKVVLSFDPDAAGQGAAAKSSELLVSEGFQVNVAMLPAGDDPDNYIRRHGAAAYQEMLRNSRPYLEYLLDRSSAGQDLSTDEGRRSFLGSMLNVAARIPDAAQRDQFADRLAHKARITEEVVRAEIRKAAVNKQTSLDQVERRAPSLGQIKLCERGLIWALMKDPESAVEALQTLDAADLEGLATRGILQQAQALQGWPAAAIPDSLLERLSTGEGAVVKAIAAEPNAPGTSVEHYIQTLKRIRYEREQAEVQREINRLQEAGAAGFDGQIMALWERKKHLIHRIESLGH